MDSFNSKLDRDEVKVWEMKWYQKNISRMKQRQKYGWGGGDGENQKSDQEHRISY